jgi:ABC-type lipoprotein release transport system permease subunit
VIADTPTDACTLRAVSGSMSTTVLDGRPPAGAGEVALASRTMRDLGVELGDSVTLSGPEGDLHANVVGRVAMPMLNVAEPSLGVVLTPDDFAQTIGADASSSMLAVSYADGVNAQQLEDALSSEYPLIFDAAASYPEPPATLLQIRRLRPTFGALAVFLGVLGTIGLVHYLAVSTRRRRRQAAVLRTIGFSRWQLRTSVAWQALTIAAIGVVIGVPAGVVVGRWAWTEAVDDLGMVDAPTTPWLVGALVIAVALAGSALIGAVPGWFAGRRPPAEGLRSE